MPHKLVDSGSPDIDVLEVWANRISTLDKKGSYVTLLHRVNTQAEIRKIIDRATKEVS